jgi:hypothetical protein
MGSSTVDPVMNRTDNLQIVTHSAGGVFVRHDPNGDILVLAHTYTTDGVTTIRVPSGTGQPGESVLATLHREMREEVAAQQEDFEFRSVFPKPVYCQLFPDDRTGRLSHLKVFFALQMTQGRHRERELFDDADTFNEERLGPLGWYEIRGLLAQMWQQHSPRAHVFAVAATLLMLAQDAAVCDRYWSTLRQWESHAGKFQIGNPAVLEYVTRALPGA